MSANAALCLEAPQTRAHASPVGCRESLCTKSSCLLGPWDSGGGPTVEQILNSKRPVEAMDITAGIVAQKKNPSCAACAMSAEPPGKSQSRTWDPYSNVPIYRSRLAVDVATDFRSEVHAEGTTSPWELQKQRRKASTRQFGGRHTTVRSATAAQRPKSLSRACNNTRQRPQRLCGIFAR